MSDNATTGLHSRDALRFNREGDLIYNNMSKKVTL